MPGQSLTSVLLASASVVWAFAPQLCVVVPAFVDRRVVGPYALQHSCLHRPDSVVASTGLLFHIHMDSFPSNLFFLVYGFSSGLGFLSHVDKHRALFLIFYWKQMRDFQYWWGVAWEGTPH